MKSREQLLESIDRFHRTFWRKEGGGRPPVAVVPEGVWTPIRCLRQAFPWAHMLPEDLDGDLCMTDYEFALEKRRVTSDDWMPFSAPWRAVPWLEAMAGCSVRYAPGSLAPWHCAASAAELAQAPIPAGQGWFDCLCRQTDALVDAAPEECWVAPAAFRGPSDALAAMRGLTAFYCDLQDAAEVVDAAAARLNRLLLDALDAHFAAVQSKLGGYVNAYGCWAPHKTAIIQENAAGLCSPETYRDVFMKYNAEVAAHFEDGVFFHLPPTAGEHYADVLAIPGLAGVEITVGPNDPDLLDLAPILREVLETSRLILIVNGDPERLDDALRILPHTGLYLILNQRFIPSEDAFRDFLTANW